MATTEKEGRLAFWFTLAGLVAAAAAFLYLWLAPTYTTTSSLGGTSSQTLAEVNGDSVLLFIGLPVLLALVIWVGLHAKCSRGSRVGETVAIGAIVLLGLGTLVGIASVGMFLIPATALLAIAVGLTPRPD